ncbi:MAG: UDP-glucose 4-epimerase GalE [Actinobacteria bacterium]|nr:UDP-glucose 4-epimerase GalE [Actinomycetota bacterium]
MRLLVTGGAGYIGSHTVVELLEGGHDVVVVDDLSNSSEVALDRVAGLTGRRPEFRRVDLVDNDVLASVFDDGPYDCVLHFAGLKAVGESVEQPLRYFRTNLIGTLNLLTEMDRAGCRDLIFSSSATVYGAPQALPLIETHPTGGTTSPYGRTKHMIEEICYDVAATGAGWRIALLRYFNPVGAHLSGRIGEDPKGIPNNLVPYVLQVAVGRRPHVDVFGNDYPTSDGTGVRDYLHVVDLAKGHLAAMENIDRFEGARAVNLGTGSGNSVLDVINGFAEASGRRIAYEFADRRPGDVPELYADPSLAAELLGWKAERGLAEICADGWAWQSANPNGYASD